MVELEATNQKSGASVSHWKYALPSRAVTLGRAADQSDWAVPWDDQVSRQHAVLTWDAAAKRLLVQVAPNARNPVYYQGQRYAGGTGFAMQPGERFLIGESTFQLLVAPETIASADKLALQAERTCSRGEVAALSYADAEKRIEVLSALPELIRQSPSDAEFEEHVVNVLLQGVPRAHSAALVYMCPDGATPAAEVRIQRLASRGPLASATAVGKAGRISRRLVHSAVYKNRQTGLHRWGASPEAGTLLNNQSLGLAEWAICAPLADDASPGWALYVAGADLETTTPVGPTPGQLQDSDIKFVATVSELVGALRALRELQKRQAVLSRFFSRAVVEALAGQDMEAALKPRVSDVTVLCCDLRGSCRIAEEREGDLTATCDRVSAALEEMTTRIIQADGVISDFQGDSAMSFWGWPQRRDNDAEQAARAALAISRSFALLAAKPGHSLAGFACGLGLASGPGVAGRLGTIDQFKIGVFGPTINLAARLESLTKLFRVPIVADDTTAQRIKGKTQIRLRRLAKVQPYGMTKQLMIYEVLPPAGAAEIKVLSENQRLDYEAALDKFTGGDWAKADPLLAKLRGDGPSQFLRSFMSDHQMRLPADWAGVVVLSGK